MFGDLSPGNYIEDPNDKTKKAAVVECDSGDKALAVKNCDPITVTGTVGTSCQISNTLKYEYSSTDIDLPSSQAWQDVWNISGDSGLLYGFALEFSSNRVQIRLTVDGNEIFDFRLREELEDMAKFGNNSKKSAGSNLCGGFELSSSDRLQYCPPCPIRYTTSILLEAKSTSGNREVDWKYLVRTVD